MNHRVCIRKISTKSYYTSVSKLSISTELVTIGKKSEGQFFYTLFYYFTLDSMLQQHDIGCSMERSCQLTWKSIYCVYPFSSENSCYFFNNFLEVMTQIEMNRLKVLNRIVFLFQLLFNFFIIQDLFRNVLYSAE